MTRGRVLSGLPRRNKCFAVILQHFRLLYKTYTRVSVLIAMRERERERESHATREQSSRRERAHTSKRHFVPASSRKGGVNTFWRRMFGPIPTQLHQVEDKYFPGEPTILGSCENVEERASRLEVFGASKVRRVKETDGDDEENRHCFFRASSFL